MLEENRMFTEAADLFVKEMRLARERLPKSKYFERLAHYIYEFFSRYGESIDRLIKLALSFIFLMPLPLLLLYNPGVHMLQQIARLVCCSNTLKTLRPLLPYSCRSGRLRTSDF
jgi:hypothetical protein